MERAHLPADTWSVWFWDLRTLPEAGSLFFMEAGLKMPQLSMFYSPSCRMLLKEKLSIPWWLKTSVIHHARMRLLHTMSGEHVRVVLCCDCVSASVAG